MEGSGLPARLLRLLIALQAWTVVGLAILYLDPGGIPARLECARRLTASAACLAAQEVVTDAWRLLHFWPQLGAIALGYLAIVAIFLRGPRDQRRGRRSRPRSATTRGGPASPRRHVSTRRPATQRPRPARA